MKAIEFQSTLKHGGHITIPPEVAQDIPAGEQVRVVVMWDPSTVDEAWRSSGRRQFEEAYCPEDDVYEQLLSSPKA